MAAAEEATEMRASAEGTNDLRRDRTPGKLHEERPAHGRAAAEPARFTLLSDEPIASDGDPLHFDRVATELARTILRSKGATPFTLGIEGGWGTGKSSLMRQIEAKLRADPLVRDEAADVTTVWFNAWAAEGASALEGLIKTVLQELDPRIVRRAVRTRRLVRGAHVLGLLGADLLHLGRLVDVVWEHASADALARNELRGLMHEAMKRWHERSGHTCARRLLAVFVDDLDRASPAQVFEIFEAMKLYLDAPGFVFVVGYDQAVVSESILEEKKYSRAVTGREYLEKIMQVAYLIPPPDDDQAARLLDHYTDQSGTAALFTDAARSLVIDRNQRNPRRIKRFLNTFVLLYGLEPEWREIGPERLVDVLLLEMHFPEFVELFRVGPDADPVSELLRYRDEREKVLGRPKAERDEALDELQRELPEQFPVWVVSRELVGLVESLRQTPEWEKVRQKLQRRRPLTAALSSEPWSDRLPLATAHDGVLVPPAWSVLVIDDLSTADWGATLREMLPYHRGNVTEVSSVGEARRELLARPFDVLVIRVERHDDPERGFADLAGLADLRDQHSGPVVLFASRLTPERRRRAQALDVDITNDAGELARLVAAARLPSEPDPRVDVPSVRRPSKRTGAAEDDEVSALLAAVEGARQAAAVDPARRSELAASLDVLSSGLWGAGYRKEAVEAGQEAVAIYRTLVAEAHRDRGSDRSQLEAFLQQLSRSVATVNRYLGAMGRPRQEEPA